MKKIFIFCLFACASFSTPWSFEGKSLKELNECEKDVVSQIFYLVVIAECGTSENPDTCFESIMRGEPSQLNAENTQKIQKVLSGLLADFLEEVLDPSKNQVSEIQFPNEGNLSMKAFSIYAERYKITNMKEQLALIAEQYPDVLQDVCAGIKTSEELNRVLGRS